jgi:hypothetical protein
MNRQNLGVVSVDGDRTSKVVSYTFEYAGIGDDLGFWTRNPKWRRTKKRFESIEDAVRASGLWMQICFDNDCPVAVRLVEV